MIDQEYLAVLVHADDGDFLSPGYGGTSVQLWADTDIGKYYAGQCVDGWTKPSVGGRAEIVRVRVKIDIVPV